MALESRHTCEQLQNRVDDNVDGATFSRFALHARTSEGNRRFRALCGTHLDLYKAATSKVGKSQIVTSIVDAVRANGGGAGGFVGRVRACAQRGGGFLID